MSSIIKEETGPRDHQMHVSCFSETSLLEKFVSELLFWWLSKQLGKPSSGPFAWLQVNRKPTLEIAPHARSRVSDRPGRKEPYFSFVELMRKERGRENSRGAPRTGKGPAVWHQMSEGTMTWQGGREGGGAIAGRRARWGHGHAEVGSPWPAGQGPGRLRHRFSFSEMTVSATLNS